MTKSNRNLRLSDSLTRGLTPHERSRVEESFKAAPTLLRAVADRLEKMLDTKLKEAESPASYLNFNWSEYQADNRGYRRAIRDVLNLFMEYK